MYLSFYLCGGDIANLLRKSKVCEIIMVGEISFKSKVIYKYIHIVSDIIVYANTSIIYFLLLKINKIKTFGFCKVQSMFIFGIRKRYIRD